jgi:predicted metal-binding membrane protein
MQLPGEEPTDNEDLDTGVATLSLLERRTTITVLAVLFGLAAIAWWLQWYGPANMGMDFLPGMSLPMVELFCPTWATMTVAMMLPTLFPIVLVQRFYAESRGEGGLRPRRWSSGIWQFGWPPAGCR